MNGKLSKVVVALFFAASVPFVGWSTAARADDAGTSGKCSDKCKDPEFKKAVIKHHEKMFFEQVKATPDQQTKISTIFADEREAKKPLKEKMHSQMRDFHELLASNNASDDQIRSKAQEVRQTRDQLMDSKLDTMLKVRAILTPEQRDSLHKKHGLECGERHGGPGGKHHGFGE